MSAPPSADVSQLDEAQLRQLEGELTILERNYSQMKDLTEKMNKRARKSSRRVEEQIEGEKLQNSIYDLERQGKGLRTDLNVLRSQMVDLDKRKTSLEMLIKQLP